MNTQLFISILLGITVIILIVIVVNKYKEIRKLNKKIEDDENYRIKKLKEQLSKKTDNLNLIISERDELVRKYHEMSDDYKDVRNRLQHLKALLERKDKLYELIENKTEDNLKFFSSLVADHLLLQYSISADCLEYKSHPAYVEAKRIRELKETTKGIVERHKIMEYKYEYLINLFPELENYVDDFETLKSLTDYKNVADFQENVDRTINYLTKDEYNNLSIEDRNQLALNRYIDGQKTKWQIGRDYELYIGYEYYREGWQVEYYGIEKQLEDMGRDLIAIKGDEVHVIQCKYWSSSKLIHEKHIAQLYGTTIQYLLSNKHLKKKIFPVFITNIELSQTAKLFSDYLNVEVLTGKIIGEFPRIKCNINKDENGNETRIYHLPMDQQYDRTKIDKKGELFAFTVKEAMDNGFRRAKRYFGV